MVYSGMREWSEIILLLFCAVYRAVLMSTTMTEIIIHYRVHFNVSLPFFPHNSESWWLCETPALGVRLSIITMVIGLEGEFLHILGQQMVGWR